MKKINRKPKNEKTASKKEGNFVSAALKGTGTAIIITCIIFVICALVLTYTDVNDSYMGVVSTLCTALSSLVSGFIWAKGRGKGGLVTGIGAGILYCVIVLAVSILAGGGPLTMGTGLCFIVGMAGGGIGGIFGVNKK